MRFGGGSNRGKPTSSDVFFVASLTGKQPLDVGLAAEAGGSFWEAAQYGSLPGEGSLPGKRKGSSGQRQSRHAPPFRLLREIDEEMARHDPDAERRAALKTSQWVAVENNLPIRIVLLKGDGEQPFATYINSKTADGRLEYRYALHFKTLVEAEHNFSSRFRNLRTKSGAKVLEGE